MPRVHRTPLERFMAKVEPEPNTGCWLWTGAMSRGYGYMRRGRRMVQAHRIAYETFVGPIPDGLCVLHRCDTRACVNPTHLFLGTLTDNNRDRAAKGRSAVGERSGQSKLTAEDVLAIRARAAAGESQRGLAREYGISHTLAHDIVHRRWWAHV